MGNVTELKSPYVEAGITVRKEKVYGEYKFYPVCQRSKDFATMLNQKTLTNVDLALIERIGHKIFVTV